MRLFVAVTFPDSIRAAIQSAIDHFPVSDPPWRWAAPENWHLTLKFLGETSSDRLQPLIAALDDERLRHHSFDMELGAFGAFPNLRAPRVLFYNVEQGAAELERLATGVDHAVRSATGLALESRRFHAHATVARVKDRLAPDVSARLARVPALTAPVTRVAGFELVESRLQRTGAVYSTVKEFALP
ncbi:MAG TPA: RNA 2',3'-cyclic phosphodiesterase [Candidatus Krumholzibacteria bacterium]|nr:RNA 2',3'-cyclic phosphodiesterase [Candidatus Krumholzibacteria bacterium]